MSHHNIIQDLFAKDKSKLMFTNAVKQTTFNPISKNFENNFVHNITKVNRSKVWEGCGVFDFRNEGPNKKSQTRI